LLNKYAGKFETQQKALEVALESLDKMENMEKGSKQNTTLTREEEWEERHWSCIKSSKVACFVQKDGLKILLENTKVELILEYMTKYQPMVYNIEYFFEKPLQECSLKMVVDGLVSISRLSNWFDTVDLRDNDDNYMLIFTHSLGLNNSKINKVMFDSVFKTYGVKYESTISEKTIFMTVFKNQTD
jgi:hypothetical protein